LRGWFESPTSATCSASRAAAGSGGSLPEAERETVDGWLRHLDFCDREIAAIEKVVAAEALARAEIRRLMTVPGVNVITAATFIAAVGEIDRFPNQKKLVGYLGLDEGGASARPRRLRGRRGPAAATS
jgi:transposase